MYMDIDTALHYVTSQWFRNMTSFETTVMGYSEINQTDSIYAHGHWIYIYYILPWIYQTSVTYIFSKTCWNDAILRVVIFLCKTVQPQDFSWSPFRDAIGISRSDPFSARSTNVLSPRSCFNAVPIRGRMPVVALHVPKHGAFLMSLELQSRW